MEGRGRRWAYFMFVMTMVMSGITFLFAFAYKDVIGHIAKAFIQLLGGIIILVIPAYIIGCLVDRFKKNNTKYEPDIVNITKHDNLTSQNKISEKSILKFDTPQENSQSCQIPIHEIKNKPVIKPIVTNLNNSETIPNGGVNKFMPTKESSNKINTKKSTDDFYAQAWDEINDHSMTPDKALWAKSFAFSQGDEKKAQSKYIELRVEQLIYEQKQLEAERVEQLTYAQNQRDAEIEKKKKERIEEELMKEEQQKIHNQYNAYISLLKSTVTKNWLNEITGNELIDKYKQVQSVNSKINSQDPDFLNTINAMLEEIKKRGLLHLSNTAEIQNLSNKYEQLKDTIISAVKKTLKTKEEIQILEGQSRLSYNELIKLGDPGQLTDSGLSVYKLLIREINKTLL